MQNVPQFSGLLAKKSRLGIEQSNIGNSLDLSMPVMDRALFHSDNSYFIPHVSVAGTCCKTNLPSNTAFRGFGGPVEPPACPLLCI